MASTSFLTSPLVAIVLSLAVGAEANACHQRDKVGNCVTMMPLDDDGDTSGHVMFQSERSAVGVATTVVEDPFNDLLDEFADGAGIQRVQEEAPSSMFERFLSASIAFFSSDVFKHMDDDFDHDLGSRGAKLPTMPPEQLVAQLDPAAQSEHAAAEVVSSERSLSSNFIRDMFWGALGAYCFFLLKYAHLEGVFSGRWGAPSAAAEEEQDEKEDHWGCSKLHAAAADGDALEVQALLRDGLRVCVDSREAWGETPLHMAARHGNCEVCSLLLANGADVNTTNDSDETPLLVAGRAGNKAACACLLDHGAGVGDVAPDDLPPLLNALLVQRMMLGIVESPSPAIHCPTQA